MELKRAQGFDIFLNPKDNYTSPIIGITGSYEPEVTRIFKNTLNPGDKVIDIGANIGWFTLLSAKIVGRSGLVVSIEPEPTNFSLLSRSVERNQFTNVRLLNQVASEADGTLSLHLAPQGDAGAHSITLDFGGKSIQVRSSRLETIVNDLNLERIDLVKVDVERAEPQVISGMRSLITGRMVRQMIVEWTPAVWAARQGLTFLLFEVFAFTASIIARFPYCRN